MYELKFSLLGIKPTIWRSLLVPSSYTLYELHHVTQIAFEWQCSHLYMFTHKGKEFGDLRLLAEEFKATSDKEIYLSDIFRKEGDACDYEYDFGDSWKLVITLMKIQKTVGISLPICIDGEMAAPPEDCGGTTGFKHLVAVMNNKKHPEYVELSQWIGKPFDAYKFTPLSISFELKNLKANIEQYEEGF